MREIIFKRAEMRELSENAWDSREMRKTWEVWISYILTQKLCLTNFSTSFHFWHAFNTIVIGGIGLSIQRSLQIWSLIYKIYNNILKHLQAWVYTHSFVHHKMVQHMIINYLN